VILEIKRLADYARKDWKFSYLRTKDDAKIDLIIDRPGGKTLCVEIKSTHALRKDHLSSFIRISQDVPKSESICLSLDPHAKKIAHVRCLHWQAGLEAMGLVNS
jgi:hypothetical protein